MIGTSLWLYAPTNCVYLGTSERFSFLFLFAWAVLPPGLPPHSIVIDWAWPWAEGTEIS